MTRSADPALPPRPVRTAVGAAISVAIAVLVAALLWSILSAAAGQGVGSAPRTDVAHLVRMTSIQAGLTTVLSLAVGTALAWSLNRLRFPGRGLLTGFFASAIVTPGIVVAFGLLAVWGRAGWINAASQALTGAPFEVPIFGLGGILAAHVILDGAFAAVILLGRLDAIPPARLKTGHSLGFSAWRRFAVIDWPTIRATIPGLAAIIFLLAFTSFPIVLLLGGGPANQTLEVAIYSAVRLDFDLEAAVVLALVQIGVCATIIVVAAIAPPVGMAPGHSAATLHWPDGATARVVQWTTIALCTIGFALPLLAVLSGGIAAETLDVLARPIVWRSALSSLVVGTCSAALAIAMAFGLAMARAAARAPLARIGLAVPAYTYLAVPAVVLSLGFFLFVRGLGIPPGTAAPAIVVIANALLALPFAVATLGPPLDAISRRHGRLIRSLGIRGWRQFALVEWPLIGRDVGLAVALAFCFSFGDLGVIALFGTQDFATLPLTMLRALGAYRNNDAAVIAALMLAATIVAFVGLPRLFGRIAHAVT